ncbi:unnamed protein product [Prorocentrum cordatum]|uniref:Uncharacterized protein n=2 Tax=Prorocentrum cordatum TaxID=2364126 RepID=A0ABN9W1Q9_9DINO|nr:unnamed protein product [Polarella glacialis]
MDWLSSVLLAGFVVYAVIHQLSVCGLGPDIHFIHYDVEVNFFINVFLNVCPIVLNFKLVQSYGRDLRLEAKCTKVSVQAASDVGRALVDFDLDKAHYLMTRMEEDSPIFEPLMKLIDNLRTYRPFLPAYLFPAAPDGQCDPTNRIIAEAISGKATSWSHVTTAVERLRDPDYSLNDFHTDMETAFPELQLYTVESDGSLCSSGRTSLEEYQRTLGALYSVYCIARLDMDGKEIFSFGVDVNGKPMTATSGESEAQKIVFYRSMDWRRMLELFARAGLLKVSSREGKRTFKAGRRSIEEAPVCTLTSLDVDSSRPSMNSSYVLPIKSITSSRTGDQFPRELSVKPSKSQRDSELSFRSATTPVAKRRTFSPQDPHDCDEDWNLRIEVDVERMTAFLALTAIHDMGRRIMKNPCLSMTVHKRHAPYQGVAEGCQIHDHDLALMYVMEHFPGLLPSFHGLGPGQRAAVFFSQGKMGFNNGWLVQGEAPPGALFSKFKEVITLGGASEPDICFYFAHWLTDLAGAEPFGARPWPGSEKFAQKFPIKVLRAFLDSFNYVGRLSRSSEVEVMEEYLHGRWLALDLPEDAVPEGCAVASRRVALMAQGFELAAVTALKALPAVDRDLLAAELARTGLQEQFASGPPAVCARPLGPALLVYYAPALVQKAGAAEAGGALLVLAAVCRAARELFPLEAGAHAVRTGWLGEALKVLTPQQIGAAGPWLLRRVSPDDAVAVPCGSDGADDTGEDVALIRLPDLGAIEPGDAPSWHRSRPNTLEPPAP